MSIEVDQSGEDGIHFLLDACHRLKIDEELTSILISPSREIRVDLPLRRDDGSITHFSGYRVQHHNALGPYKGGLRYHSDVSIEEFRWLACLMSLKTALVELPLGGSKGGIDCDPRLLSRRELQQLTRYFVRKMHRDFGPNLDIPAPDVGTNQQIMAWIHDEYSVLYGFSPAAVTGKPLLIGGAPGREEATGRGVGIVMHEYAKYRSEELKGKTVAIQGLGNVGRHAALDLDARGMRIVAVSDSQGTVYSPDGLDILDLVRHKDSTGSVASFKGAKAIDQNELFALDCDYLIPAALGHAIDENRAASVSARAIVEAANNPISYAASCALEKRGIAILPDILVNAGGVIVSYFEWVQNLQQLPWTEERISTELNSKLQGACTRVFAVETAKVCGFRAAAYEVAVTRLRDAVCTTMF